MQTNLVNYLPTPVEGQLLYILNEDDDPATFAGETIEPNNGLGNFMLLAGAWHPLSGGASGNAWELLGNGGTNPSTNYLGTTDNQPLVIRTNNIEQLRVHTSGRVDQPNFNSGGTAFGHQAGLNDNTGEANTYFGYQAGMEYADAGSNTFIGYQAGRDQEEGIGNTYVGHAAGQSSFEGSENTVVGSNAGQSIIDGGSNTIMGYFAARDLVTGNSNVALGASAGQNLGSGSNNTLIGTVAGRSLSSGDSNTVVGRSAGRNLGVLDANILIGFAAGRDLQNLAGDTDGQNLYIGNRSGEQLESAQRNVFIGHNVARSDDFSKITAAQASVEGHVFIGHGAVEFDQNISRGNNPDVVIGFSASPYNAGGGSVIIGTNAGSQFASAPGNFAISSNNTIIGENAVSTGSGSNSSAMNAITALGQGAGRAANDIANTVIIGYRAGANANGAQGSVLIGVDAGDEAAANITAVGFKAGQNLGEAENTTCLGQNAGFANTNDFSGDDNTCIGAFAGHRLNETTLSGGPNPSNFYAATRNTLVGTYAGKWCEYGEDNTFIGYNAGHDGTATPVAPNTGPTYRTQYGRHNTFVGSGAGISAQESNVQKSNSFWNATAIGYQALVDDDDMVRLGNDDITVIEGQVTFSATSDGRLKQNVQDYNQLGLNFIRELRPVSYKFNSHVENSGFDAAPTYNGFIAQEVEASLNRLKLEFSGLLTPGDGPGERRHYALRYSEFVVPLVNAVQELDARNQQLESSVEQLASENAELKAKLEQQNDLEQRLQKLEAIIGQRVSND